MAAPEQRAHRGAADRPGGAVDKDAARHRRPDIPIGHHLPVVRNAEIRFVGLACSWSIR